MFHILNGDCLAEQLKETSIQGETIIFREALIAGPLQADNLKDFCKMRADFLSQEYHTEQNHYYDKVFHEIEEILNIPDNSEVNLWFEDDLFCQVNMWFCITLLSKNKTLQLYRIFPKDSGDWKGFSTSAISDLEASLKAKVLLNDKDIELAFHLWNAFKNKDNISLKELSGIPSSCFHYLEKVIDVYLNKNPEDFIRNLAEKGTADFPTIFEKFQEEFGELGLSDLQVGKIYEKI
ncbi:DUF1835 domain-containing protein [Chryseobacterium sp. CT-SW4]|uniref:DUF1835 domain-containing protein n=1 Tax=Chryseobacterium sp. SW-1 TaxID=3157343 RepID=UPI003B01D31D